MVRRTRFRPCIDLHEGKVKQIVGGTLDSSSESLKVNFTSDRSADWYAERYASDQLEGGHIIKLGPGNDESAKLALAAYPNGLQIGGGITTENAASWLNAGASHVIATSFLFDEKFQFRQDRLDQMIAEIGKDRLVIDLSCRRDGEEWIVAMNRWQTKTNLFLNESTLDTLSQQCAEFLIHAADVEGRCQGIDSDLVSSLGVWAKKPLTYAGGAKSLEDLNTVNQLSAGLVDLTIGSALDIFGGSGVKYAECVKYNSNSTE
tara:strand:- start:1480 stop:2262 length:783 start_codon:yes stop_codon:yes gene_type:complete